MSLAITTCNHSASLVMPNGNPQDGFFYPTLTLMMDSYRSHLPDRDCCNLRSSISFSKADISLSKADISLSNADVIFSAKHEYV